MTDKLEVVSDPGEESCVINGKHKCNEINYHRKVIKKNKRKGVEHVNWFGKTVAACMTEEQCGPKMKAHINSGVTLIVDRYAYSGVAFSAAKEGMDIEWCKEPEAGLPKPDAVFFLTLSPEALARRGGFGEERYEATDFQENVRNNYRKLEEDSWQNILMQLKCPAIYLRLDLCPAEVSTQPVVAILAARRKLVVMCWDSVEKWSCYSTINTIRPGPVLLMSSSVADGRYTRRSTAFHP
ncbi:uncharacterized protein [Periplaneta americana]|uniref:uncharacterized protein isoform X2 n=1 Tax=Periplaneta americana TaxID=6978 RepID=UPI0037E75188